MGGIKNHIQSFGLQIGQGFSSIDDPLERHMAFMSQQVVPYCKGCGKQLLQADQDENGNTTDWKTEQQRQMCTKCYDKQVEAFKKMQAQQQQQAPKAEEIDWEEYKKKFTRE